MYTLTTCHSVATICACIAIVCMRWCVDVPQAQLPVSRLVAVPLAERLHPAHEPGPLDDGRSQGWVRHGSGGRWGVECCVLRGLSNASSSTSGDVSFAPAASSARKCIMSARNHVAQSPLLGRGRDSGAWSSQSSAAAGNTARQATIARLNTHNPYTRTYNSCDCYCYTHYILRGKLDRATQ